MSINVLEAATRLDAFEQEITSYLSLLAVDGLRSRQIHYSDPNQNSSVRLSSAVKDTSSSLRVQCGAMCEVLRSRSDLLHKVLKSANSLFVANTKGLDKPLPFAEDMRRFGAHEASVAPDSPTAGLVCQMAELSADLHALDKATHEETATMVQMPLSSVELGQSTEKMKSFLTKSIKAFEGFKPKGSFGHFGLAKARREMHIKLCKYMSDLYQARERFEIQLVQHLNDLYDAQQRHHEEALRLMTERRAGLAKAQTYMQATKGVMSRRQTQLAQISQQLEEEIKDINEHEEAGRAEKKTNKKLKIKTRPGQEKEAALGNFLQQIQAVPCNAACADCNAPNPSFVSTNLGLVLCGDCAHLHETELNTPSLFATQGIRSKIRSLTGDASSLPAPADIYIVKMVGNNVGNSIWEAKLQASQSIAGLKPNAKSPKEEKQRHIVNKYLNREYLDPEPEGLGVVDGAMKQDIPYMVRLLSHGMLSQQGDAGVTALARAVELDMPVATEFLLQNGVDVDATTDVARNTPLHIATRLSHIDCVKILLRHSADHMLKNNDKQVALDYAIANNDDGCCTLINGTSPDLSTIEWDRPPNHADTKRVAFSGGGGGGGGSGGGGKGSTATTNSHAIVAPVDEWQLQEIEVKKDYSYKDGSTDTGYTAGTAESIYEPVYMNMRTMAISFNAPPTGGAAGADMASGNAAAAPPPPLVSRSSKPAAGGGSSRPPSAGGAAEESTYDLPDWGDAVPGSTPGQDLQQELQRKLPPKPPTSEDEGQDVEDEGEENEGGDVAPPPVPRATMRSPTNPVAEAAAATTTPPVVAAPRPAARPRPSPSPKPAAKPKSEVPAPASRDITSPSPAARPKPTSRPISMSRTPSIAPSFAPPQPSMSRSASIAPSFAPPPRPADSFKAKPGASPAPPAHPPVPAKPDYSDA